MESDDDREQDLEDRVFPSFQVLMSLVLLLSKQESVQCSNGIPVTTQMLSQLSVFIQQLSEKETKHLTQKKEFV